MKFRDTIPEGARAFESRLRVQWADVDVAGILYFAAYWRFAERAEMDMFRDLGFPYNTVFDELDFWLPRVRLEAEYHAPALMDDWLRMRTHIEKVGASSVRWKTVMFNERTGEAGAEFTVTVACMDRSSKKSRSLPEGLKAALVSAFAPSD
ncbi:MAG: acyl-CoA thioesterase [Candidatus Eremiobacteraeota bacterium]|nr:acyl-CoA thioesterase [Candidatus Eremiobacteraeota bacterium]